MHSEIDLTTEQMKALTIRLGDWEVLVLLGMLAAIGATILAIALTV